MQTTIPELMDISDESEATKKLYSFDAANSHTRTYARECLIARRIVERGVRFIELTIPMVNGFARLDAYEGLVKNHANNAGCSKKRLSCGRASLGARFLRKGGDGRDHNEYGFSVWLSGGGMRPGLVYGATDEWGYRAVENPLEIHDLHATMMHLLGMDHTQLAFRSGGRDFRLTDVKGNVVREILI